MLCQKCGFENPEGLETCKQCGDAMATEASDPEKQKDSTQKTKTSALAVTALVLGILSVFGLIAAIPGIICGALALPQIKNSQGRQKGAGIAITGIVLSILITGMRAAVLIPALNETTVKAKVIKTRACMHALNMAITMFRYDMGRYPSQEKGLIELMEKPVDGGKWPEGGYLEQEIFQDAWDNDLVYKVIDIKEGPFVIMSYGADGKEGGVGYDSDIYSTDR